MLYYGYSSTVLATPVVELFFSNIYFTEILVHWTIMSSNVHTHQNDYMILDQEGKNIN